MFFHLFFSLVPHGLWHLPPLLISSTGFPPSSAVLLIYLIYFYHHFLSSSPLSLSPSILFTSFLHIYSLINFPWLYFLLPPPSLHPPPPRLFSGQAIPDLYVLQKPSCTHFIAVTDIWDMNIHTLLYVLCILCPLSSYYSFPLFLSFFSPKAAWKTGVDVWTL